MITPAGWNEFERRLDGCGYWHEHRRISVIRSEERHDGKNWLHVSLAAPKRKIQYSDIINIKELFIGVDKYAFMVFPPKDKYVNIHGNCYHLFHCVDGHPFPEFSGLLNGMRSL